jgi:hypothetical protein
VKLAALQRGFRAHVTGGDALPRDAVADPRGLPVYANAYRVTLRDCLADAYAKTRAWLGEAAFDDCADAYIAAHPPVSWTLGAYGEAMPDWLAARLPDQPDVGELAWLEWRLRASFTAAAGTPVAPEALAAADWERVMLRVADHVAARTTVADIPTIWNALNEKRASDRVLLDAPAGLVVWRDALTPRFRTTSVVEAAALTLLGAGETFAAICVAMQIDHTATAADLGALLARWLSDGLIVGLN